MRRAWIAIGVVCGLLVLAILLLPMLLGAEQFRPLLKTQMEAALKRPVDFASISIRSIPPSLEVGDLRIGENPAIATGKPFLTADRFHVRVNPLALLRGALEIHSVSFDRSVVELVETADGQWNFDSLRQQKGPPIDELVLRDGIIALTRAGRTRTEYTHIDLKMSRVRDAVGMPIEVRANLAPGQTVQFQGAAGGPNALTGRLDVKDCSAAALMAFANTSYKKPLGGVVTGSVNLQSSQADGTLVWKEISAGHAKVAHPLSLQFQLERNGSVWKSRKTEAAIGSLSARATGTYDVERKMLDGNQRIPSNSISALAQLAAAFGIAFAPGMNVDGTLDADLRIAGPVEELAVSGVASLRKLEVRGGELRQTVRSDELTLDVSPQAIRSRPFSMTAGSTALQGSFTVADYSRKPLLQASVSAANASLTDLVSMAQAYGVAAVKGVKASGQASLDAKITAPLGRAGAIDARGSGKLANAVIESPEITTPLQVEKADIRLDKDAVTVENTVLKIGGSTMRGSARVQSLQRPSVALRLAVDRLSLDEAQKWFPPRTATNDAQVPAPVPLSGELSVGKLLVAGLTLESAKAVIATQEGVLRIEPVSANLHGGQITGAIAINMRSSPPAYTAKTRLLSVQSDQLLTAVTPVRGVLTGALSGDAALTFAPKEGEDIARSMDGEMNVQLGKGRLLPLNLFGQAALLGKFLKPIKEAESGSELLGMRGTFTIRQGVAETSDLRMDLDRANVQASGRIGLADQSVDLKLLLTMNRQLSEEVGGTRVGGYLSAVVSNAAGELILPMLVRGTLTKPVVSPDAATFARLKLQTVLPSLTQPDKVTERVKDVLDRFRRPKKQDPDPPKD
jgi:uncharacterized protein involved in outer membrane biogenesis